MTCERPRPQDEDRPMRPTTAIERACERKHGLLPDRSSVKCFVKWMREIGHGGEQLLTQVYIEFCEVVEVMGGDPLSLKRFRRALRNAGHTPYQADWRKSDGTRYRPQVVNLSEAKPELSVIATQMADIKTLAPNTAKCANGSNYEYRAAA